MTYSSVAAFAAAITFSLSVAPVPVFADGSPTTTSQAEWIAITEATHRRVVEMRFDDAPADILPTLLTRVDLYDNTIAEVRFDHSQSVTPGEMGVGSRRICVFTDGRILVEPLLVYDPPRAYAYTVDAEASTMSLPVSEIVLHYEFRDEGNGAHLTVNAFYDPAIPGTGVVIEPVLTGTLRRTFQTATEVFGGAYVGDARP
ncbi:MAG: hypothetical protein AAGI92_13080 [Pseudomonadota bacterium]